MTAPKPAAKTHTLAEEINMIRLIAREHGEDRQDQLAAMGYIAYLRDQDAGITPQQRLAIDTKVA